MTRLRLVAACLACALFGTGAAQAHKPRFAGDGVLQLGDGTVSYAVYGVVRPGRLLGAAFTLRAGQTLFVQLLVPARCPERTLPASSLPHLTLTGPAGERRSLAPGLRRVFREPVTRTSYLVLAQARFPVRTAGAWRLLVDGPRALRFVLAVGYREQFGPVDLVALPLALARVRAWYQLDRC